MVIEANMGRYVQAPGAVLRLCDDLRGLDSLYVMGGGRALAKALPLLQVPGLKHLHRELLYQAAPCWRECQALATRAKELHAQAVLGVGGGVALDIAKAVAEQSGLPLFLLPTVAATCSAATRLIALYDEKGRRSGRLDMTRPIMGVYVDETLLADAPRRSLASGIADSLAKLSEAASAKLYRNNPSTPLWEAAISQAEHIVLQQFSFAQGAMDGDAQALSRVLFSNIFLTAQMTQLGSDRRLGELAHCFYNALTRLQSDEGVGRLTHLHGEVVGLGVLVEMRLCGEIAGIGEKQLRIFLRDTLRCPVNLRDLNLKLDKESLQALAEDMAEHAGLPAAWMESGLRAIL